MGIEYDVLFGGKKLSCGSGQLSADDVATDGQHTHLRGSKYTEVLRRRRFAHQVDLIESILNDGIADNS